MFAGCGVEGRMSPSIDVCWACVALKRPVAWVVIESLCRGKCDMCGQKDVGVMRGYGCPEGAMMPMYEKEVT